MNPAGELRILLVDDDRLARAVIRTLVEAIGGLRVVGEADHGQEALALAGLHRPHLVLMDINMGPPDGIATTALFQRDIPEARVVILSVNAGEEYVARALAAGAWGYLLKDSVRKELRLALETVVRGERYLSPRVSRPMVEAIARPASGFAVPEAIVPARGSARGMPAWGVGACYLVILLGLLTSIRRILDAVI